MLHPRCCTMKMNLTFNSRTLSCRDGADEMMFGWDVIDAELTSRSCMVVWADKDGEPNRLLRKPVVFIFSLDLSATGGVIKARLLFRVLFAEFGVRSGEAGVGVE